MSMGSCLEGSWVEPSSNRTFSYRHWTPPSPRALLVVIHGFGEHGGRYHPFAQALAAYHISVAIPDLLGHGRSEGQRGDIEHVELHATHVLSMTNDVFLPASGQQTYVLFGHSFGGLVAILCALRTPPHLQRLVVQSPLLDVGFPIPWWKTLSASILARCRPTYSFPMDLDVQMLSHDPTIVQAYRTDPLVHNAMSARTYCTFLEARAKAMRQACACSTPLLMLCGERDRMISVNAARRWFDQVQSEKRCVIFPGCYHELHHEAVQNEVVRVIANWILNEQDTA